MQRSLCVFFESLKEAAAVGNTHDPPSTAAVPTCTSYAAITAGAVLGLTATSNSMTDVEPSMPSKNGVLFRTGTDSAAWFASDVNLIGNPNVPAYRQNAENYGWWPLISLDHANRSLSSGSPSGELPFHTFFSPEVPQRNFFKRSRMAAAPGGATVSDHDDGYDGLETFSWEWAAGASAGSTIGLANFSLSSYPSIAGQAVYLALHWRPAVANSSLSLLIDTGGGAWQESNATGLVCNRNMVEDCAVGVGPSGQLLPPAAGEWRPRVFSATLAARGQARFALRAAAPAAGPVLVSGVVIARVGARYDAVAR